MDRNWYVGSWRLRSDLVTNRIVMFPRSDTTQVKVKRREPDADSFQPSDAREDKCDWCGGRLLERHDVPEMACSEKEISKKSK